MDVLASTVTGRRLLVATVALAGADVIGGLLAVSAGANTWGEAWGFEPSSAPPWPMWVVQLLLAGLAARDLRPPLGRVAAVLLAVVCGVSLIFGLLDGDLTSDSQPAGLVVWGVVLILITTVVGLLAITRARELRRGR